VSHQFAKIKLMLLGLVVAAVVEVDAKNYGITMS
jgi:hypothetical protein